MATTVEVPLLCWLDHEVEVVTTVAQNGQVTTRAECQKCGHFGVDWST